MNVYLHGSGEFDDDDTNHRDSDLHRETLLGIDRELFESAVKPHITCLLYAML